MREVGERVDVRHVGSGHDPRANKRFRFAVHRDKRFGAGIGRDWILAASWRLPRRRRHFERDRVIDGAIVKRRLIALPLQQLER